MKAEMSEHGVITLTPETSIEAYALCRWMGESLIEVKDTQHNENFHWRGSRLHVNPTTEKS